jgi:hypothetical protein
MTTLRYALVTLEHPYPRGCASLSALLEDSVYCGASGNSFIRKEGGSVRGLGAGQESLGLAPGPARHSIVVESNGRCAKSRAGVIRKEHHTSRLRRVGREKVFEPELVAFGLRFLRVQGIPLEMKTIDRHNARRMVCQRGVEAGDEETSVFATLGGCSSRMISQPLMALARQSWLSLATVNGRRFFRESMPSAGPSLVHHLSRAIPPRQRVYRVRPPS